MDSQDFPTEDEQYEAYKAVLEGMNGKPVVVRTMEIGGNKKLPYFDMPHEMKGAKEKAKWYHSVYGENFFLELQDHGHPKSPAPFSEQS